MWYDACPESIPLLAGADVQPPRSGPDVRLAEVIAALSLATDLGMGQPLGYSLRSCVLAVRLGATLGLDDRELGQVYYLALLRLIGCTADAHVSAAAFGDEVAARGWLTGVDWWAPAEVMAVLERHLGAGLPPQVRERMLATAGAALPGLMGVALAHCEVAQRLAERMGFGADIQEALGQLYERWDGRGIPAGLAGETIARPVRVVQLAQDAEVFYRQGGAEAAVVVARRRADGAYDPAIVTRFAQEAAHLLAGFETESAWEMVLAAEPGPRPRITDAQLDRVARALADFADLKSPYLAGHSAGVATLAEAAARRCRLPDADVVAVRRAGLLHDLGRVGVSAGIWGKPGPLTDEEWERVRLHPYYTERVLARPLALAPVGALAALHHERLDGSGYHRGAPAALLPPGARILAAADVYQALTELRPHRPAHTPDAAAAELQRQVRAGRLDGEAASAVLAAAGHRGRPARRAYPAALSGREVEVLRLLARGRSTREIATSLVITEKTADHHIQHIYAKIGVSTRAAAALFAMQHGLLGQVGAPEER